MEVPGRLSNKEDFMFSHKARGIAVAIVLTALLGISAAPADARPRESRALGRAEASLLVRLWQWIETVWTHGSASERIRVTTGMDQAPTRIDRGMTIDPNG